MSDYKIQIDKSVIHLENGSFISLCREDYDLFTIATEDCFAEVNKEQLQALFELIQFMQFNRKSGWISVEEKLPQSNGNFYLVYTDKGRVSECRYYHDEWITTYCNNEKVTHWQPLPQPPKEKEK